MSATRATRAIASVIAPHLSAERAHRLIDLFLAAAIDQNSNGDEIVFDVRVYVYVETSDAASVEAPQETP
jgi:hypothetical protein